LIGSNKGPWKWCHPHAHHTASNTQFSDSPWYKHATDGFVSTHTYHSYFETLPHSDLLHQKLEILFEGGVDIEQASAQQHTALSLAKALAATNPSKFTSILELVESLIV